MLFAGLLCLGLFIGVGAIAALIGGLLFARGRRVLLVILIALGVVGLCLATSACLGAAFFVIVEQESTSEIVPPAVETVVVEREKEAEVAAPTETPSEVALSPDEILGRSVDAMNGTTSAHIVFEQEVVGSYTASGEGVLALPDRAHFEKTSTYDEEPIETIVIGATGYWVDESISGGWNSGPIAPFASNPAHWVELLRFYQNPTLMGMETVQGEDCYRLQFALTFQPGWLGLFSGEGTGEAWIAEGDFSLIKAVYSVEYEGARESDRMKLTFELSDFNAPVSIEAPR
jgi:hypothetical protein